MRILYVEDNEVNQALVERVLRAKQCSAVFRDEGEGALEVLAADQEINLVLLDIELAGAMSGLDVIRAMRARNDTRPVVAITAYAMMGDRERFLEAGCDQYLPKPLVITDLLNLLDHYEAEFAKQAETGAPVSKEFKVPAATPPAAASEPAKAAEPAAAAPTAPAAADSTPAPAAASPEKPAESTAAAPAAVDSTPAPAAASPATAAEPAAAASVEPAKPAESTATAPAEPAKPASSADNASAASAAETTPPVTSTESAPANAAEASPLTANEPANPSASKDTSR